MSSKTKSRDKTLNVPATAAGQTLGYSLQYTRLTSMLLDSPKGSICSLEVLDDIAEQTADGTTKLSQSKSALTANPVANHAVSLWKTLFNWLEIVKTELVDPEKTIFELYISRKVDGELIKAFHDADSKEAASFALIKAREALWGDGQNYYDKSALSESIARYANPVLGASEEIIIPIIINLRLVCGSGSPQTDIETSIRQGPVSDSKIFDIADKMCGWVKRHVDKQLEQSLPAFISRDEFHKEYTSYVRRIDRELILTSRASTPSNKQKLDRLPDTFVQQLELIELGYDDKLEAISEYLRACWDRVLWSKYGDVHEDSFNELDDKLQKVWRNHRRTTEIEASSKTQVDRGVLLHSRCMLHADKIQGMELPTHFVPGCFHRLADVRVIGWHPDYKNLLEQKATLNDEHSIK